MEPSFEWDLEKERLFHLAQRKDPNFWSGVLAGRPEDL